MRGEPEEAEDEIDAISLPSQVKLLRVLQSGEYQRLGSSTTRTANTRVISATNADLETAISAGRFREDLYFRLNVIEVPVPALIDRLDDVLPLAEHFLKQFSAETAEQLSLGPDAGAALLGHSWPGNVRELENRIQRATVVADTSEITPGDLNLEQDPSPASSSVGPDLDQNELLERKEVLTAISDADGVVAHAAAELGLSRQAFYRKMSRLGIELERRPRTPS